jgi:DNA-binding CsgD family transcriptional regulator
MPLADAVIEAQAALEIAADPARASRKGTGQTATPGAGQLSPRELDVLRLVAAGRSDREIGAALFISPRTASKHVGSILAKLGLSSRAEAAAFAARSGLG